MFRIPTLGLKHQTIQTLIFFLLHFVSSQPVSLWINWLLMEGGGTLLVSQVMQWLAHRRAWLGFLVLPSGCMAAFVSQEGICWLLGSYPGPYDCYWLIRGYRLASWFSSQPTCLPLSHRRVQVGSLILLTQWIIERCELASTVFGF